MVNMRNMNVLRIEVVKYKITEWSDVIFFNVTRWILDE